MKNKKPKQLQTSHQLFTRKTKQKKKKILYHLVVSTYIHTYCNTHNRIKIKQINKITLNLKLKSPIAWNDI